MIHENVDKTDGEVNKKIGIVLKIRETVCIYISLTSTLAVRFI